MNKQEKLYTVASPYPDKPEFVIALKRIRGSVRLINTYEYIGRELLDEYKLTKFEIKKDFEWAWKYAKPVEDR